MDVSTLSEPMVDVVVVGAGVAGLSAAITLTRAGYSTLCVDPVLPPRVRVGESLDWAAPSLLERVGLPYDRLVADRVGTWKREVHGVTTNGLRLVGRAEPWMSRWPLRFQLETIHVDRVRFDAALYDLAASEGARFIADAVTHVDVDGDRVIGCSTRSGRQLVAARWYLDGSGRARVFARALGVERCEDSPARVALWAHREARHAVAGTVLHLDDGPTELRWAWEIPVGDDCVSLGVVVSEAEFKEQRRDGRQPGEIFERLLGGFGDLEQPKPGDLNPVQVRSFRSYTHERVSGSNWIMIGEAAALVDPLTSTGVSAALRHGIEAAEVALTDPPAKAARARRRFDRRVRSVATLYNRAVEGLLYSPDVRRHVGIRGATQAYVIIGFGMSVFYARVGASGLMRHTAVMTAAGACRLWSLGWQRFGRAHGGAPMQPRIGEVPVEFGTGDGSTDRNDPGEHISSEG